MRTRPSVHTPECAYARCMLVPHLSPTNLHARLHRGCLHKKATHMLACLGRVLRCAGSGHIERYSWCKRGARVYCSAERCALETNIYMSDPVPSKKLRKLAHRSGDETHPPKSRSRPRTSVWARGVSCLPTRQSPAAGTQAFFLVQPPTSNKRVSAPTPG